MKNKNIKAILFDMVGVLLFVKPGFSPTTKEEINASHIEKLYNHTDDEKLLSDIRKYLKLKKGILEKALECIPQKFEKYDELWKILPQLKKNYNLAIINNGNALAMKYWSKYFDFSLFNFFINSAQEGVKKPDPEIYLLTCKRLGVNPGECIFIDDAFENIQAARDLGMTTAWWNKEQGRKKNLKQFLQLIKNK